MTHASDDLSMIPMSGSERLPIVLESLKKFGRPASMNEIYEDTKLHPVILGKIVQNCPKSLRVKRRHGSTSKAGSWIVEPHPDIARHWPEWMSGKGVAA